MNNIRMKFNTAAVEPVLRKVQIKEIAILITASLIIQLIIHLVPPVNGIPLGAILLPMFYVPLIAIIFYKFHTALVVTAFGPILNYLLTGNPKLETVPLLTFEVLVFVFVMVLLLRYKKLRFVSSLVSILAAFFLAYLTFGILTGSGFSGSHLFISLKNAVPGIIILSVMNPFLLHLRKWL